MTTAPQNPGDRSGSTERDATALRTVRDAATLKALAHPLRQRLLDVLRVHGPSTVSGLARRLDVAIGSVSHHLGVLARAGLVEEDPERAGDRREHWYRRADGGVQWSTTALDDAASRRSATALEVAQADEQAARVRRWVTRRDAAPDALTPIDLAAFAHQSWLWLDAQELTALQEEVLELLAGYRGRGHEGREPVLFWARAFPEEP